MVTASADLRRNIVYSGAQALVGVVVLFFVYRLVFRTVGAGSLGVWSLLMAMTSLGRVADFGFSAGAPRFVADSLATGRTAEAARCIETAATITFVTAGLVGLGCLGIILHRAEHWMSAEELELMRGLAPWALLSFLGVAAGGVYQGALDGLRRSDLRLWSQLAGQALLLAGTLLLVPRWGIEAFGWSMAAQSWAAWLAAVGALRCAGLRCRWLPWRADQSQMRRMLGLGMQLQLISVLTLLSDPVTKYLLGRFGGLASVGVYEMAAKLVQQVHVLVNTALRPLVPAVAALARQAPASIEAFLVAAQARSFRVILPAYTLLAAGLPLAERAWLGGSNPNFMLFGGLLCAGWMVNASVIPQYVVLTGLGRLRWLVLVHLLIGAVNALAGWLLGAWLGATGPVLGWVLALVTGSWLLARFGPAAEGLPLRNLFPAGQRLRLLIAATVGTSCLLTALAKPEERHVNGLLIAFFGIGFWFVWVERRTLLQSWRRLCGGQRLRP